MNIQELTNPVNKCALCFNGDDAKRSTSRQYFNDIQDINTGIVYSTEDIGFSDIVNLVDMLEIRIGFRINVFPDARCTEVKESKRPMCMIFTRIAIHDIFEKIVIIGGVVGFNDISDYGKKIYSVRKVLLKLPAPTSTNKTLLLDAMEAFLI